MDKIPLRTYLKEVENLIDKGDNDQAIAHCRHILKAYPKNLGTYRLLGKAYLENRRYGDAADVFQRVLSGAPDDFVSHVGMSIIREDESNQDAAIWHMERAFEIQPYNSAIQDELRRLYGRRDGLEPPKVRLTRGALARMYARGNLYQQAIGELRAALAEDPKRSDLQVLLARMYFMAGQKVEAVETCSILLKKLPYCLEANRIISAILPETERKEETQVYRERVMSLDPYLVLASPYETSAEGVRDQVVVIEKLDYQEGETVEASQPAWAASLGVTFDEFKSADEPVPDWLQAISDTHTPAVAPPQPVKDDEETIAEGSLSTVSPFLSEDTELIPSSEDDEELPSWISFPDQPGGQGAEAATGEVPDWMKEAGWEAPSGGGESSLPAFEYPEAGEVDETGIEKGEIPEWLQALAPDELEFSATSPDEEAVLASMPWLQESAPESVPPVQTPEASSDFLEELGAKPGEDLPETPEWLKELGEAPQAAEEMGSEAEMEEEPSAFQFEEEQAPEAELAEETFAEQVEPVEEMPDWLKEVGEDEGKGAFEEPLVTEALESKPVEIEIVDLDEDISDVMQMSELDADVSEDESAVEGAGLAAAFSAGALFSEESQEEEGMPDWLKEEEPEGRPDSGTIADEAPAPLIDLGEESPVGESAGEEVPSWMQESEAQEFEIELPESELPTGIGEPEEYAEDAVSLEESESGVPGEPIEARLGEDELASGDALEPEGAGEEIPAWLRELGDEGEQEGLAEGELESLAAEPLFEEPATTEALDEWMQEMEEPALDEAEIVAEEPAQALESGGPGEEIPAWLRELSQEAAGVELDETESEEAEALGAVEEVEPIDEIPAWMRELEQEKLEPSEPEFEIPAWETGAAAEMAGAQESSQSDSEDELDWLQIIGEKPLTPEPGVEDRSVLDQPEYTPEDLEALLADTQPVRVGGDETAVPFNEILEEIDAGMQTELTADDIQASAEVQESVTGEFDESPVDEIEGLAPGIFGAALAAAETETALPWEEPEGEEIPPEQAGSTTEESPAMPAFDLEDQEASLAWLESLAAKHGVSEEELFTSPEERPEIIPSEGQTEEAESFEPLPEGAQVFEISEAAGAEQLDQVSAQENDWIEEASRAEMNIEERAEIPDWLKELEVEGQEQLEAEEEAGTLQEISDLTEQEIAEEARPPESRAEEAGETDIPDWLRDMQVEAEQELSQRQMAEEASDQDAPLDDSDAAMAWMESLAAKQGVSEDELFTKPEDRLETPPEWVEAVEEDTFEDFRLSEVEEAGIPPEEEEHAEQSRFEETALVEGQIQIEAEAQIDETGTGEGAAAELGEAATREEMLPQAVEPAPVEEPELPEWLAESETPQVEEEEWTPPVEPVKAALREPRPGTAPLRTPPSEPVDINKASLVDLETLPGVGFILAQNILTYRDAFGAYTEMDDLLKVPGITPGILAEIREYLTIPPVREARKPVEPELQDDAQSSLLMARNKLAEGDVEGTIAQYSKLVKNRELLPEIIRDLKEALYRFPVDIGLWQVLGDAYMRSDQLTEALEAYTKAEELLR